MFVLIQLSKLDYCFVMQEAVIQVKLLSTRLPNKGIYIYSG